MELIRENVKVEWVELREGLLNSEYDPSDQEDIELLRFDVSILIDGEWKDPGDASYCTMFPAGASDEDKRAGLSLIMDEVFEPAKNGHRIKKICEKLSWISPEWIK